MNAMLHLAQETLASEGRLLGLTVDEWIRLLPVLGTAIASVVVAVYMAVRKAREATLEAKKVRVLSDTIEEHASEYPGQASRLKGRALHKANKAGVQEGAAGMKAEAAKAKARFGGGPALALLLCFGLALLAGTGCAVGPKAADLIETECRAHDADLAEWGDLTPEQRQASYEDSRAGVYEIRHSVLGVDLPPDLQAGQ